MERIRTNPSKNIRFDFEDEIISSSVLVFNGEIKNERFK